MIHIMFLNRSDEQATDIVAWEGCDPEEFADRLKRVMVAWGRIREGKEAFEAAGGSFSVVDLDAWLPTQNKAPELNVLLWRNNIRYLRIIPQVKENFVPELASDTVLMED